ncbi:Hypothetical protein GbCGDNIH9_7200 [Granulibacter bethesdensis]|uniref:Uncharacterized protein n=1 Tax=Granulibacter bethesdensis TaxID=364410 RepID=A0AAC9KBZ7_9PROT|nr:Hypothetical protein GbCGDNIH9_7200 [Granulibacter bethesdensis]APH62124.1 Hypothetical protein GbCGDNIH8_7200a [Granulibacter bethesdensis]
MTECGWWQALLSGDLTDRGVFSGGIFQFRVAEIVAAVFSQIMENGA